MKKVLEGKCYSLMTAEFQQCASVRSAEFSEGMPEGDDSKVNSTPVFLLIKFLLQCLT